jgi:hypothetical protein
MKVRKLKAQATTRRMSRKSKILMTDPAVLFSLKASLPKLPSGVSGPLPSG